MEKAESDDNQMIQILPPDIQMSEAEDPQFARIMQILGTQEIPKIDADTLQTYLNYLKAHLQLPCLLKGIESIGYFGWEERFEFGYGSKAEYESLRREYGSLKDEFELQTFEGEIEPGWDILVNVRRTSDGKRFTIPLSELEAVDETSENSQLLNDYTVWIVNWR
ncbi:MAG: calcium-binding protein [Chloroflexota bacterium]